MNLLYCIGLSAKYANLSNYCIWVMFELSYTFTFKLFKQVHPQRKLNFIVVALQIERCSVPDLHDERCACGHIGLLGL